MRFRRKKEVPNFDYPYTFKYELHYEHLIIPQPWRDRDDFKDIYFAPTDFVLMFADRGRMSQLRAREAAYIADLAGQLLREGIKVPLEINIDINGKMKLQEGHHRMCGITGMLGHFPRIPVKIKRVPGVMRGSSRELSEAVEDVFRYMSSDRLHVPSAYSYGEPVQQK